MFLLLHYLGAYSVGKYKDAEPLYRRVVEITEETLGKAHPQYYTTLSNLAGLLRTQVTGSVCPCITGGYLAGIEASTVLQY